MRHRVRVHPDFVLDLEAVVTWISAERGEAYLARLQDGIREATDLLSRFPRVGTPVRDEGSFRLRKLILRRLPYVIWYAHRDETARPAVWLVRLFHVRQDRPATAFNHTRKGP